MNLFKRIFSRKEEKPCAILVVRYCTLVSANQMIINIAQGRKIVLKDNVKEVLKVTDVYFASIKKDGKEFEVYCI